MFVYCCKYDMWNFTFSRWQTLPAEPLSIIAGRFTRVEWNIQITKIIYQKFWNSIAKSYILNIKIRPLVTEYALTIKLVGGTSSAHSCNSYAYFWNFDWNFRNLKKKNFFFKFYELFWNFWNFWKFWNFEIFCIGVIKWEGDSHFNHWFCTRVQYHFFIS